MKTEFQFIKEFTMSNTITKNIEMAMQNLQGLVAKGGQVTVADMLKLQNDLHNLLFSAGGRDKGFTAAKGDSESAMAQDGDININTGSGDDTVIIGPQGPYPGDPGPIGPYAGDPVAANETGTITGDPHFKGGDGGRYDVQGEAGKTYDLLSDSGLEFRGRFDSWGSGGATAVGQTGLSISGGLFGATSQVGFSKDGSATIDGRQMEQGQTYQLADGGTAVLNGKTLTVKTAEGYSIEQSAYGSFINAKVTTGDQGVGHGKMPGGLLGQTFDADKVARNGATGAGAQGEGAIEGKVQDYEKSQLFGDASHPWPEMPGSGGKININTGSGDDVVIIGANGPVPGPVDPPGPNPGEPVAANEHGRIWGDPHFVGGDGGHYDVQGEAGKTYNLLSDSGLQLNGKFDGWSNGVTVVGETGLTVAGDDGSTSQIGFSKDGKATLNGEEMVNGRQYQLADGGTAVLNGKNLVVTTAEGYTIQQTASGSGDKAYINIDVSTGDKGVGNGQLPGGLLGQTFDADNVARNGKTGAGAQGEGAIDGNVADYEVGGLFNKTSGGGRDIHIKTGSGDDRIEVNGNKEKVDIKAGSGDDEVILRGSGNRNRVDGGSGDDHINVEYNGSGNSSRIKGGSGYDVVTLKGSRADYTVSTDRQGNKIYTDKQGNTTVVGRDVEKVEFSKGHAPAPPSRPVPERAPTININTGSGDDMVKLFVNNIMHSMLGAMDFNWKF
jgi:hypothetical protein